VVAPSSAPTYEKVAELRRFAGEVEANVSAPAPGGAVLPRLDVIWAIPSGHTLVYREPRPFAGKLTRPADDGKLVPQGLVKAACALLGQPSLPIPGNSASELAAKFASKTPRLLPRTWPTP
jgi:hypothetical protein